METTTAVMIASALIAAPAAVAGAETFPGLPGQADYGMCTAYNHAADNATTNAPVFQNASYDEDCSEHKPGPSDEHGQAAEDHRQDEDAAEQRQDDQARQDGRSYGEQQADEHRPDGAGPP